MVPQTLPMLQVLLAFPMLQVLLAFPMLQVLLIEKTTETETATVEVERRPCPHRQS